MFSGIWIKITAALGFAIALLAINSKRQANKIDRLEHENKTIHKKSEMQETQSEFKAKVMADEADEMLKITKEVKGNDKKPSLKDINNL